MERRGPSHSGPYGLACTSCFKSKSKCVARPDGDGCQRCHRLHKQCRPSDGLRRRALDKKQSSAARIAELEGRLGDLISQLQSRNVIGGDSAQRGSPAPPEVLLQPAGRLSLQPSSPEQNEVPDGGHTEHDDDVAVGSGQRGDSPQALPASARPEPRLEVSEAEGETLLGTFRSCMLPRFAFVHLPAHLTAHQLRHDRPFLFQAIICAVSPSAGEQLARGKALKMAICEAMLGQESQSSTGRTDLLLALLTYISWGWDHVLNHGSLSRLMLHAISLASEMRLEQPTPADARMMALFTPGFDPQSDNTANGTRDDFLERQRAVLGCFVLSSAVAAYYGQIDALRWTQQMEDGLAAISSNHDCPTDAVLAMQVRLQLLSQKSVQVHQQQQLEQGQVVASEMPTLPALMALTTLQSQLQDIQMSLAPALRQQALIRAHIHATELCLSEATHAVNSTVPIMVREFARMTGGAGPLNAASCGAASSTSSRQERLQCLWQCVRAIQACTSALLVLPPSEFRGISFVQWAQLARCVVTLNRLTSAAVIPAWDHAAVRAIIDVPELLSRVAGKLELVARQAGEQGSDGVFTRLARRMREFCADAAGRAADEPGLAGHEFMTMSIAIDGRC